MSDTDSAVARELHKAFQRVAPDVRPGLSYEDWDELPEQERRLAVRACWQAVQGRGFLAALLEEADLDVMIKMTARETVIRHVMAETGESRQIVTEMVDAAASMDQEAVLDLTDGQPTTLRAALERYLEEPWWEVENMPPIRDALSAILAYPYPEGDGADSDVMTVRKADGSVAAFLSDRKSKR